MKYAFIDYENLHSLDGLNLSEYEKIFLFMGANLKSINLTEKFSDEINITLVTIQEVAKNNVDFHIAYYLGKLDMAIDKNIEFYILSNDRGYDGVCKFIANQRNGRVCFRKGTKKEISEEIAQSIEQNIQLQETNKESQALNEYISFIKSKSGNKKNLPTKHSSLQNDIHNRTCLRTFDKQGEINTIQRVIDGLVKQRLLNIDNSKVSYL